MKRKKLIAAVLITAMIMSVFTFASPLPVSAGDENAVAAAIRAAYPDYSLIIFADTGSRTVTVTGTVTGTKKPLKLDIDAGVTVIWKAIYEAPLSGNNSLIELTGGGTFEVAEGGHIANSSTGNVISVSGVNATVNICGGTVRASDSGKNAVRVESGTNVAVNVSGGTVSSNDRPAISFAGTTTNCSVDISGGAVSAASKSYPTIYFFDSKNSAIDISGGVVSAADKEAVYIKGSDSTVTVSGGFVFAWGTALSGVISTAGGATLKIEGAGIVCAWKPGAPGKEYTSKTADDIFSDPAGSAVWGLGGGQGGIAYSNGANTGFFPIEGVTVKLAEYTITFDTDGGGNVSAQVVKSGEKPAEPADPAKEGYEFEGWHEDAGCTVRYSFDDPVESGFTLYAKWTAVKTDPAIDPAAGDYVKGSGEDIFVTVNPGGHNLKSIKSGAHTFKEGTDYKVNGDEVTLTAAYLEGLELKTHTITFEFDGGAVSKLDFKLTVGLPLTSGDYKYTIGAGSYHTAALDSGGSLWAWGYNGYGQLGDGTAKNKNEPVQTASGTKFAQVSAGEYHTLALDSEGSLWAWGRNDMGQLGDGTTENKNAPVQIASGKKFTQVSAGTWQHTAALDSDGNLWAWGNNLHGQLGDGSKADKTAPVQISSKTKFVQISAGGSHTVALDSGGNLWAWGNNGSGQLGDGTTAGKQNPTQIKAQTKFAQVSAGGSYTAAIDSEGNLWAWGYNWYGQLGDGTTAGKQNPTQIKAQMKFAQVSASSNHTAAIAEDGSLWAWGWNKYGQLGDGTTEDKTAPVQIKAGTKFVEVSAGFEHTIAMADDGSLWVWGYNEHGQIGDGSNTDRNVPVKIEPAVKPADAAIDPMAAA
ncbi:MAG: InlB B-repeat-containing protein, partial [Oscillospiraceae bacterium]|nr:InlB B-repeat-containing protein [Oscillospiraceae bacterium]